MIDLIRPFIAPFYQRRSVEDAKIIVRKKDGTHKESGQNQEGDHQQSEKDSLPQEKKDQSRLSVIA
jgi:hypothetical protein